MIADKTSTGRSLDPYVIARFIFWLCFICVSLPIEFDYQMIQFLLGYDPIHSRFFVHFIEMKNDENCQFKSIVAHIFLP